jgi:hypothetical protein
MEEASEDGRESPNSAHANGMNEFGPVQITGYFVYFIFFVTQREFHYHI